MHVPNSSPNSSEPQPGVPLNPAKKAVAERIIAELVAERGAPSLDHYRRVYRSIGVDWPGDDEILRLYPVANNGIRQ